jgi:hypothetical protein
MTVYSVTAGLQPPALSVASSPVGELTDLARSAGMSLDQLITTINAAVAASGRVAPDLPVDEVVQRIADQRKKAERSTPPPQPTTARAPGGSTGSEGRLLDVVL